MTVTKCAECPYSYNAWMECWHGIEHGTEFVIDDQSIISPRCPIASGKPFNISFTPLNESNETN